MATGGDTLTPALARRFFEFFGPDVELRNLYGPTEAVVDATWWRCDPAADGRVPIGRPVANTQTYVLDAGLRPVPTGAPGELCIGGDQVARGYLNRPELTAERFVPNPFRPRERIYRTGDAARFRHDGAVSCSSAATMTRSRSAASASSSVKSRPQWQATRPSGKRSRTFARTLTAAARLWCT